MVFIDGARMNHMLALIFFRILSTNLLEREKNYSFLKWEVFGHFPSSDVYSNVYLVNNF